MVLIPFLEDKSENRRTTKSNDGLLHFTAAIAEQDGESPVHVVAPLLTTHGVTVLGTSQLSLVHDQANRSETVMV